MAKARDWRISRFVDLSTVEAVLTAVASPAKDDERRCLWLACLGALFWAQCAVGRDSVIGSDCW